MHAFGRSDYAGDEPHYLLTARSLLDDGDVDLVNQYATGAYRPFYPYTLDPHGSLTGGRLDEPHGLGFPVLIAPAYAAGGAQGVEGRPAAITALGVAFATAVFVGVNGRLYGGPSPNSAAAPGAGGTGADFPLGYARRAYRLVALLIDREFGLLRWAPILALAVFGAWLLLRERRGGLARAIPTRRSEQAAATLCALVCGTQLLVAAFVMPSMFGFWFPGRHLVAALPLSAPPVGRGSR